jgi:hypothetical protein
VANGSAAVTAESKPASSGDDARGQQLVIPALAIGGALPDARSDEADDLLGGLELLDNVIIAPWRGTEQAARLADIIARTGLDPWHAHAAAIADVAIYSIRTLGAAKWQQPSADLDEPLHIVEIADPMSARMSNDMCTSAMAQTAHTLMPRGRTK